MLFSPLSGSGISFSLDVVKWISVFHQFMMIDKRFFTGSLVDDQLCKITYYTDYLCSSKHLQITTDVQ